MEKSVAKIRGFVTDLLKKNKALTEREVKAAIGRAFKLNPKTISAGVIRDVRKKLGIDRPGAIAFAKALLDKNLDELTVLLATEMGKVLAEAKGDVLKAIEVVECACSSHYLMQGDTCMNVAPGYDTVSFREPLGVFVGGDKLVHRPIHWRNSYPLKDSKEDLPAWQEEDLRLARDVLESTDWLGLPSKFEVPRLQRSSGRTSRLTGGRPQTAACN